MLPSFFCFVEKSSPIMERLSTLATQLGISVPSDQRAVVVTGVRTPFTRAFGEQLGMDTIDLGAAAVKGLLEKTKLNPNEIDHLAWGGVILRNGSPNTGREIVLDLKLPPTISAHTESMACISGLKAVLSGIMMIESGNASVIVAGGSDSVSCTEVPLARNVSQSLALYTSGKISAAKLLSAAGLPCSWMPQQPGVAERSTGKTMGFHADVMSELCGVKRQDQDRFAIASHTKAAAAIAGGVFDDEIVPVTPRTVPHMSSTTIKKDTLVRMKQDEKKAASLKPVFRKAEKGGTITAASASPLTDGGAAVLLMSKKRAKELGYAADVAVRSWATSGIQPEPNLLLAPALAFPIALRRAGLSLKDIDYFEIHEAFAGQVLATIQCLASPELCKKYLGLDAAVGEITLDRVNIYGGSVSIGHPFGATGARLITNAARILRNKSAKYVLISVCAAGGLGMVTIVERL
jgi:acetyl-CoA acyltransferase